MSINFKWPNRKKAASSARKRPTKGTGRDRLASKKPASGWTIKINPFAKTLAQIAEGDGEDSENEDYLKGYEAAQDAFTMMDEASDDFALGFMDGVMSMLPDDVIA